MDYELGKKLDAISYQLEQIIQVLSEETEEAEELEEEDFPKPFENKETKKLVEKLPSGARVTQETMNKINKQGMQRASVPKPQPRQDEEDEELAFEDEDESVEE